MLTERAYRERYWGPLKEFRRLFESGVISRSSAYENRIRGVLYGHSSVSDNLFASLERKVDLSLRISGGMDEILHACQGDQKLVSSLVAEASDLIDGLREDRRSLDSLVEQLLELLGQARLKLATPTETEHDW